MRAHPDDGLPRVFQGSGLGWLVLLAALWLLAGCTHTWRINSVTREAIYSRADTRYEHTVLVKPAESDRREFMFAPLLVQESNPGGGSSDIPYSLYFWSTRARGLGTVLEQYNYIWFHPATDRSAKNPQGIRITFDPEGQPVVWEILREVSGARVLFVSQSLEGAAMTNYTAPLPGRRFWVERSVSETPDVVVARILDDGPAPMGPIVYLDALTHEVGTVICRCMAAQADEVVGTGIYGLASLDDAAVRWLSEDGTPGIMRWLPGQKPDDLDQWLRIQSD